MDERQLLAMELLKALPRTARRQWLALLPFTKKHGMRKYVYVRLLVVGSVLAVIHIPYCLDRAKNVWLYGECRSSPAEATG